MFFEFWKTGNPSIRLYGKLYNANELANEKDATPEEIVKSLYLSEGIVGMNRLDGMFVIIIREANSVHIIRDHHGTGYQVYYTDCCFASSPIPIVKNSDFAPLPNFAGLSEFLSSGYISTPESGLKGMQKLGAGEALTYVSGKLTRHNLFPTEQIRFSESTKSLDDLSAEYKELHTEAIRRRIGQAQRVGMLLSGGYDSGCNLVALRSIFKGEIDTYSVGFKGDNWSELPLTKVMSDRFETRHHQYEIDGSEIDFLPQIVAHLGDPFVEGGVMVNFAAMRMIGETKPEVLLGGDGSDQYFGTSGREVALHYLLHKKGLLPLAQCAYSALSRDRFNRDCKFYRARFHLDKILNILKGDLFGFPEFALQELIQKGLMDMPHSKIESQKSSFEDLYTQHAYVSDLERVINQVILFKASRMAEMFDNHLTYPYMDLTLYQFLQQVPVRYKCKGETPEAIAKGRGTAKFLLKHCYEALLPEEITSKKKQGGFAPMPIFFKDDVRRQRIGEFIMESSVTKKFLNEETVRRFIQTYDRETKEQVGWFWYRQNKAIQYFELLSLAIWWELFIERKSNVSIT